MKQAILNNNNIKKLSTEELFKLYAETSDDNHKIKYRNELVERNKPLVTFIINKYYNKSEHKRLHEDLLQEGIIGLMSAIDGFDIKLGYKFSTYSTWWIKQAVNNYISNIEPAIHIPSHIRSAQNKVLKHYNSDQEIKEQQKFYDSIENSCEFLDMTKKMTQSVKSAFIAKKIISLEDDLNNNNKSENNNHNKAFSLKEVIQKEPGFENDLDKEFLISIVERALDKLSLKKRLILLLRFNVLNNNELKEILKEKGKSKEDDE